MRNPLRTSPWLALPAAGWLGWFLLAPLSFIVAYSLAARGPYGTVVFRLSGENFARAADPIYLKILWSSLKLAALTTVSCLAIGFPMAYAMARASRRLRGALLVLVMIPFWTNFVVRVYALKVLLAESGPVNRFALWTGLIAEPFAFANTEFAVWLGMVTNYLPFMVLPIHVALEKFDFTLLEAARDLGAPAWRGLLEVLVPLARPGIVTGALFVFTPALGEFVVPDLLGGARTMLIGNLITDQFLKTRDWPFGSALSLLLILTVLASLLVHLWNDARGARRP
ncbi:MAG: ABC transporter permease [Oligoflexia bacterium]|nr:ABC transporter permease [Oligoflexia bacterium]